MYILQIEHPVPNYEGWKKAFDSDPVNRKNQVFIVIKFHERLMIQII